MSKKNKAQKQLLRAQIEQNRQAISSGKNIGQAPSASTNANTQGVNSVAQASNQEISEFVLIKKDIYFSLALIAGVIVIFLAIYLADRSNPFLLPLANKIFSLLGK